MGNESVKNTSPNPSEDKPVMTKVSIITRGEKFEELRKKMCEIGVTGMTVSHVEGCGRQHGIMKVFEGVKKRIYVSPKIKVDIVVCSVPVEEVIRVAQEVLFTGKIGDGKIFTSRIDHVVRIRTNERDKDAL